MLWVFLLLALVLIVAFALVLAGRLPSVPQPTRERYIARLPERPSAGDVDQLRLRSRSAGIAWTTWTSP